MIKIALLTTTFIFFGVFNANSQDKLNFSQIDDLAKSSNYDIFDTKCRRLGFSYDDAMIQELHKFYSYVKKTNIKMGTSTHSSSVIFTLNENKKKIEFFFNFENYFSELKLSIAKLNYPTPKVYANSDYFELTYNFPKYTLVLREFKKHFISEGKTYPKTEVKYYFK